MKFTSRAIALSFILSPLSTMGARHSPNESPNQDFGVQVTQMTDSLLDSDVLVLLDSESRPLCKVVISENAGGGKVAGFEKIPACTASEFEVVIIMAQSQEELQQGQKTAWIPFALLAAPGVMKMSTALIATCSAAAVIGVGAGATAGALFEFENDHLLSGALGGLSGLVPGIFMGANTVVAPYSATGPVTIFVSNALANISSAGLAASGITCGAAGGLLGLVGYKQIQGQ